ncbi:MAG: hypothetical protein V4689_09265 [Verrucomicrobiota bacterium]
MKISFLPLVWLSMASAAMANTPPTVVIQSAVMRPGTTLMDVVYRVNDPDDATVKTRALAFVDGTRSFAKVLKPVTFVEGTAAKLGDAIPANVDHTLTWNVSADWSIDLGQVKFEVLAMDQRGLLPFDWITIPAAGEKPALTISKDSPTDAQVLNALFWQYAAGDAGLSLTNGVLRGNATSGVFNNVKLANGAAVEAYGAAFVFKRMNLAPATSLDIADATNARANLLNIRNWHALNQAYAGMAVLVGWGSNEHEQIDIPAGLSGITAITTGQFNSLILRNDGTVLNVGVTHAGDIPPGLSEVTAISMGSRFRGLALKKDGTVVQWSNGTPVPAGLSGVTAIAAAVEHGLALKSDGKVVQWSDVSGAVLPAGLSGITAIAAGWYQSLALKSNGTVVAWGQAALGFTAVPAGLNGVIAISAGRDHFLALKSTGTVVAWGDNNKGQTDVPAGLNGVIAVSAGDGHSLALKSNGTVVGWGNSLGTNLPAGLNGVIAIAAGEHHNLALKAEGP